jgi:hypothetical protein
MDVKETGSTFLPCLWSAGRIFHVGTQRIISFITNKNELSHGMPPAQVDLIGLPNTLLL